jgi:hypothetical protein
MRTRLVRCRRRRAGVISLAAWKKAKHAADVLRGLLNEPAWLGSIAVRMVGLEPCIVVRLAFDSEQALRSTPVQVNDIAVVLVGPSGRVEREAATPPKQPSTTRRS